MKLAWPGCWCTCLYYFSLLTAHYFTACICILSWRSNQSVSVPEHLNIISRVKKKKKKFNKLNFKSNKKKKISRKPFTDAFQFYLLNLNHYNFFKLFQLFMWLLLLAWPIHQLNNFLYILINRILCVVFLLFFFSTFFTVFLTDLFKIY